MVRVNLSTSKAKTKVLPSGNLSKRQKHLISTMFNMEHVHRFDMKKFNNLYVNNQDIENFIQELKEEKMSKTYLLVGAPGSGKSTYIRKCLNVLKSLPIYIQERNAIVIPLFLNFTQEPPQLTSNSIDFFEKEFQRCLKNACNALTDNHVSRYDPQKFKKFLEGDIKNVVDTAYQDRLGSWIEIYDRDYSSTNYGLIKFLYLLIESTDKRIINIEFYLDDIENIQPIELQIKIVKFVRGFYHSISKYLTLYPNYENVNLIFKLLVAIRPITYNLLYRADSVHAYGSTQIIHEPVPMSEIWDKTKPYSPGSEAKEISTDANSFDEIRFIESISEIIKHGLMMRKRERSDFINALFNNNIRLASAKMACILSNHLLADSAGMPIGVSQAQLIRMIALEDGTNYDSESGINVPNIIRNFPDKNYDLLMPYLTMLLRKASTTFAKPVTINYVADNLKILFKFEDFEEKFDIALNYLIDKKVVRTKKQDEVTFIYAMPKLFTIYRIIKHSSILIEIWFDDIYYDYGRNLDASSLPFMIQRSTEERFSFSIELVERYYEIEAILRSNKDCAWLVSTFGKSSFTEKMLEGVIESENRIFNRNNGMIPSENIARKLNIIKHKIHKTYIEMEQTIKIGGLGGHEGQ